MIKQEDKPIPGKDVKTADRSGNPMISKLHACIAEKPEILFAYLFGSQATGRAGRLSDLDLALYLDPSFQVPESGYGYRSVLVEELSSVLGITVDVVLLNHASILLKHQVLKNGQLIYSRSNPARRSFHEKTIREYLDFKPLLRVHRAYLRKRLLAGTYGGTSIGRPGSLNGKTARA